MNWSRRRKWPAVLALASMLIWVMPIAALQQGNTSQQQKSDQTISDQVEDELIFDQAVFAHKIDIETDQGIVQLSGNVSNLLAKKRAAKIAEAVRGVRAVVNNIEVNAVAGRTDQEIQDDVEAALLTNPATESFEVSSKVNDGFVNLTGTVESWQEKQLSEKVAAGVYGVRGVNNSILVDYEADRPDSELAREVREIFKWDVFIPNDDLITVKAVDGEIRLSGTVGSAAEKSRAYSRAWVAGVNSVDHSKLKVESWPADRRLRNDSYVDASDPEIKEAAIDAMLYDPYVNSFNVNVDVENRTVTLRGLVDNLKAKQAAERDARNTAGVLNVNNRLKVRLLDAIPTDETVEENVESALIRSPYVQSYEISTLVDDGKVSLYGTVDNFFEKAKAEDAAASVRGAIVVDNNIVVTNDDAPQHFDPLVDDSYYDYHWDLNTTPLESDKEIRDDIQSELFWSPFVDSDQVTVNVDDGTATLTGTVDSWTERDSASENAYEGGAVFVDNDLLVK
ncbi:MAG: BON domain-containing protein [Planctomycetaceae bacterium]|nr:BON domain-containing protein [Planctomycetaceae bacterium]